MREYTRDEIGAADRQLAPLRPALATYYGDVRLIQLRLNEAKLFLRGVLRSPAMTMAQRLRMIDDMQEFLERTEV